MVIPFNADALACVRQQTLLFENISFTLQAGDALFIEGANGSGKSSLLRLLAGLATPHQGHVYWYGDCIQEDRLTYYQHLHYIGHTSGIKLGLTVLENLQLIAHLHGLPHQNLNNLLLVLHLHTKRNEPARALSAGQKRRIALAKLFLFPKTLWILDEPLTALDQTTQSFFLAALENHLQQGGMAIISTHQPITLTSVSQQTLRLAC